MTKRSGKTLRKGITTGTCAAAGAKAAAQALFAGRKPVRGGASQVEVTLPRGGVIKVSVKEVIVDGDTATATVVKDAGDDPDVTNGADIVTTVKLRASNTARIGVSVRGGSGVGVVTKPGLKTRVGSAAINPVPLKMIKTAVVEAARDSLVRASVLVTVSVPKGEELADKTMNPRLGIRGGISILGTTGIVEPLSLSAYTHSISCAVDVALAAGSDTVVFSTGRSSEKAAEDFLKLPPECFVLTGDHMGFALRDAKGRPGLKKVIVAGQFGKFTKLASGHFETHCSDSSVELKFIAGVAGSLGASDELAGRITGANTAREVFFLLKDAGRGDVLGEICDMVRRNSAHIIGPGVEVGAVLVGYRGEVTSTSRVGP